VASVVLDTHAWLWLASDPDRLSETAAEAIAATETIGVPTVCCWEIAMLVRKERIALDREIERWIRAALGREGVLAMPLTPEVAVSAGMLDEAEFPGDPADRMIYATARVAGAPLVTRDAALRRYDSRGTLW